MLDKTKPCAVFVDIDGTLMDWAGPQDVWDGRMPAINAEAIRKAQKIGHKILISTGRGYACLPKQVIDEVPMDGYVTALGAMIDVDGKNVYTAPIPREKLEQLVKYVLDNHKPCRFQGRHITLSIHSVRELYAPWVKVTSVEQFFAELGDDVVSKITIDADLNGEYLDFLLSFLNVYHANDSGEACMRGCNKADGMRRALEALNIPLSQSVAIGDSMNDEEILHAAAVSVAMGNAPESLKATCTFVTDRCEEGGVGKALEKLGLTQ